MQITITMPDELAARVQARGLSPKSYVETWLAEQTATPETPTWKARPSQEARLVDLERFLEEMAAHSDQIPLLPDEAFTRESFYQDHD